MGVRDQLPDGQPLALLRELDRDAREIKAAQTMGQDSVISYRIFSNAAYDVLFPAGSDIRTVTVEFIPDDMTFGGAFCYRCKAKQSSPGFSTNQYMPRLVTTDGTQKWTYSVRPSTDYTFKFYFFTTGSGTFTTNII